MLTRSAGKDAPRILRAGQFLQQRLTLAEPWPLTPLHVPWQRPLLRDQFLHPLPCLVSPVRRLQKTCIVVQRLRSRRNLCDFRENLIRTFQLARLRIRIRQQSRRPVIIEFPVARDHSFQVAGSPISPIAIGIAIRKGDPLKAATQQALSQLYANGTMKKIVAKWGMTGAVTLLK